MDLQEFDSHRRTVDLAGGPVSYVDVGPSGGRTVLFVHGLGTNAYLWSGVIAELSREHRCVAPDWPLHGQTPMPADQDFTLGGLARFVEDFCAAMDLTGIDLVGNDTGGAVCQTFAVAHPERLATFTLTNCDTHDNLPPDGFEQVVEAAQKGLLAPNGPELLARPAIARRQSFGGAYEDAGLPDDVTVRAFLEPVLGTVERGREFERLLTSLSAKDLMALEPKLRELTVPTLIVWGTDDRFFELKWAYWLRDTIAGAREVVEVPGGRLFFPHERPHELVTALRAFWS